MATPCNIMPECSDGSDEFGCDFPDWYLYSTSSLATSDLVVTCFFSLLKAVKKDVNEIMQDTRWRLVTKNENNASGSIKNEKLMKVAFYAEKGDYDAINILLTNEMIAHGNEADVMCCLKVNQWF